MYVVRDPFTKQRSLVIKYDVGKHDFLDCGLRQSTSEKVM